MEVYWGPQSCLYPTRGTGTYIHNAQFEKYYRPDHVYTP
jgi:hypothetical protein